MKKSFIIISACLLLATCIKAQPGLQVGIRLIPELTGISNKNDADAGAELDYASHFGYSFGAGAVYNINNHVGFGLDILFSREGQNFTGDFTGAPLDPAAYSSVVAKQASLNNQVINGAYVAKAELNYIKVPLFLSLTTDNTRPLFFTLQVGPQINFLQGVAQEVNHTDLDYPNTSITPQDLYQSVTFCGVLALGGAYNLSSHLVLSARVRFDYGFTDAEKKDVMVSYAGAPPVRFYSTDRSSANSMTAGLMVGLDFKL
jgi:hypothetical protein